MLLNRALRVNNVCRKVTRPGQQLFRIHDASKPFPPPQPTRPIDILEQQKSSSTNPTANTATTHDVNSSGTSTTAATPASSSINSNPKTGISSNTSAPTASPSTPSPPPPPTASSPTLDAMEEDAKKHIKEEQGNHTQQYNRSHHFDTYELLTQLEQHGFTRKQAEVLMKGIKFRLRECTASMKQQLLLNSDLENESYLFKAALSELRTEVQVMRRNDMQKLQTELSVIAREVEALDQKLNESMAEMKNEIQMDMNNRKNETKEDQKTMELKIQEINNKFTIRLGDIRTEIEAIRWETIWKGLAGVFLAGFTIASMGYVLTKYSTRKAERLRLEMERKKKAMEEEANRAGTADMEVIF